MITKYQEELRKLKLLYIVTKELNDRYKGVVLEKGLVIIKNWVFYKDIAPSRIPNFAALTKQNVETHKRIMKLLGGFRE